MDCLMTYVPHNDLNLVRKLKVWIAWLEKQGKQNLLMKLNESLKLVIG